MIAGNSSPELIPLPETLSYLSNQRAEGWGGVRWKVTHTEKLGGSTAFSWTIHDGSPPSGPFGASSLDMRDQCRIPSCATTWYRLQIHGNGTLWSGGKMSLCVLLKTSFFTTIKEKWWLNAQGGGSEVCHPATGLPSQGEATAIQERKEWLLHSCSCFWSGVFFLPVGEARGRQEGARGRVNVAPASFDDPD